MQWVVKYWTSAHPVHAAQAGADKDPVCGMTVKPDSAHATTHDGRLIRFCSAKCLTKFAAEPQRYLTPSPAPEDAAPAGTQYTCPIHPEIRQPGPGSCPKCGMSAIHRCRIRLCAPAHCAGPCILTLSGASRA